MSGLRPVRGLDDVVEILGVLTDVSQCGRNRAGQGWFVDTTPATAEEFMVAADGQIDLLTVLLHELGHLLGFHHAADSDALMAELLEAGSRRLPGDTTDGSITLSTEEPTTVAVDEPVTSGKKGRSWLDPLRNLFGKS